MNSDGELCFVTQYGGCYGDTPKQLAQSVLDQVITYPESHDQNDWVSCCGTTACVAGWVGLLHDGCVADTEWDARAPGYRAQKLLGLTAADAIRLFHFCTNAQAQLALKYLANGETVDWDTVGHKYTDEETFHHMWHAQWRTWQMPHPIV